MSDIDELQRRITAAMDRVAKGLDGLAAQGDRDDASVRQQLDEEKTVNAQLTERVRVLKERQDAALARLEAQGAQAEARMTKLDTDLQKLRRVNAQLTEACDALRRANEEGVGEPHLINKAMMAELESLRAARAVDLSEADTILGALTPLLQAAARDDGAGAGNAAEAAGTKTEEESA
ncbi:hypothetical protein [Sulfitobacter sabulilitoris]|uniref:hypothetical protein n=1 Tax=Sulfitobacter sabulilitoris TaxID=2562655 RepID=UPI001FE91F49|nr:hypothetical protein [Sulfitobacter sabulilitoris]